MPGGGRDLPGRRQAPSPPRPPSRAGGCCRRGPAARPAPRYITRVCLYICVCECRGASPGPPQPPGPCRRCPADPQAPPPPALGERGGPLRAGAALRYVTARGERGGGAGGPGGARPLAGAAGRGAAGGGGRRSVWVCRVMSRSWQKRRACSSSAGRRQSGAAGGRGRRYGNVAMKCPARPPGV